MGNIIFILFLALWTTYVWNNIKNSFLILVFLTLTLQSIFLIYNNFFATDILGIIFLVIFLIKCRISLHDVIFNEYVILGIFFIFLYLSLPLLGFLFGSVETSLADSISPSLRFVQWVIYGFCALYFGYGGRSYGDSVKWLKLLILTVLLSIMVHTIYSFFQFMAFFGLFSYSDLPHIKFFDDRDNWIYWWRATGLLANPNTYGTLSFFGSVSILLLLIWKKVKGHWFWVLYIFSVVGVILSGSRTALILLALISGLCIALSSIIRKFISINSLTLLTLTLMAGIIIVINSERLDARFLEIIDLFGNWGKIQNLTGRFSFWENAIQLLVSDTQFMGTLISPYRIYEGISTDNGYIALLLQFPFLPILFMMWMISGLLISLNRFKSNPFGAIVFSTTIISLLLANLTINLMIEGGLLVVFFVLNGASLSLILRRKMTECKRKQISLN